MVGLSLAVLAGLPSGCGTADPAPEAGPDARGSFALMRVERAHFDGALLGERFAHFEIGGRVVRYSGMGREETAAVLGTGDLMEPEELDACEAPAPVLPREEMVGDQLEGSEIELVDVGVVDVRAGDRSLVLEPQSFPGLMSLLQGAIYGTTDGEGVPWEAGADWTFAARGASGIGGFEVTTDAPDELVVLRIGADDPTVARPLVERALDLPIRWEAGRHDDVVSIEIDWAQLGTEMRLRCAAADDGAFVVPASMLRQLPDPSILTSPRVVVRRERRRPFAAAGLDEGLLVVSLEETFDARVR